MIKLNSTKIILGSFFITIIIGTFLLSLPFSSQDGTSTDLLNCLFTATSSLCVTGLVVVDTATHWSFFGQFVILLLIQIGGLGVIVVTSLISIFLGQKISFWQRTTLQEALSVQKVGGIIKLTRFVLRLVVMFELSGAFLLFFRFIKDFDFPTAVWYSLFHSISAFCNAGFDLFGTSSFIPFKNDIYINIVVISLMLLGGIGFFVIEDLIKCFKKKSILHMEFHTKIILIATLVIYTLSVILIKIAEPSLSILQTLFTAATCRTTGFSTVNLGETSSMLKLILSILMMIGGAPGSTSGGIRITSIAVVILIMKSVFENKKDVICFYKKIDDNTIKQAITNIFLSITIVFVGILLFARIQDISLVDNIFMCVSSFSATGLNVFSPSILNTIAKFILMTLMFIGRVGPISIVSVFILNKTENKNVEYVSGKLIL